MPKVREELGGYLRRLRAGESVLSDGVAESMVDYTATLGLIAEKEKIVAGGEYNLSGKRYRETQVKSSHYEMIPFEKICTLEYGASLPKKKRVDGHIPVMGSNGISGYHNEYLIKGPAIIVGRKGSAGEVTYINSDCFPIDTTYYVKIVDTNRTDILYLYHLLKTLDLPSLRGGAGIPGLNRKDVYDKYKLPLPPLKIQREIVAEIEGYQRVIDGAQAVIDNYRPQLVVDPEWPMVELGEAISLEYGKPLKAENRIEGPYPVFGSNGIVGYHNECLIEGPVIIIGRKGSAGAVNFCESPCYPIDTTFFVRIRDQQQLDIRFCYYQMLELELDKVNVQSGVPGLNRNDAYLKTIALPPLEIQQTIVAEIETEQSLVAANRELVERMEGKIRAAIGRVWGDE